MTKCNVGLIGISGFGWTHLNTSEKLEKDGVLNLSAICELNYEGNREEIDRLVQRGVRYYRDYSEMLAKEKGLDFVVISTPIHLHRKMAIDAMNSGYNVLLEKPPAVTIQDIDEIIRVSGKTGKHCAVDFMLTSGKAFLRLKKDITEGKLGKIRNIVGAGLWKRLDSYYSRTPWAGKLLMNGSYVLDGSVNNPLAHLLNNMLFLAGASGAKDVSAVTAELYHAHMIEGDDTSCIKTEMDNGIGLYFYTTLCNSEQTTPYIIVDGTDGRAVWNYNNEVRIEYSGQNEILDFGEENDYENMYRNLCAVISGEEKELYCSVYQTRNFVLVSNGAYESSGGIHAIPAGFVERYAENESTATGIKHIDSIIGNAAGKRKLFSETGVEWAVGGKRVIMDNYKEFKMFK